jgi:DNA polymerase III subunit epsilon
MWLDRIPSSVVFCDVETTGLAKDDRIVSLGAIGMMSGDLAADDSNLRYTYLVFNPRKGNHRRAEQVHGFSDRALRLQDPFAVHARRVRRFLRSYELLVAHNAAFDFRFVNRELARADMPALSKPVYCTMKGYRALGIGGSASLSAVCRQIKLARSGQLHGAMEDAWLCMQVYLWLHGCRRQRRLPDAMPRTPSNFREISEPFALSQCRPGSSAHEKSEPGQATNMRREA